MNRSLAPGDPQGKPAEHTLAWSRCPCGANYLRIPKALDDWPHMGRIEAAVFAAIADRWGANDEAWPSLETIARDARCGVTATKNAIVKLERAGLLIVERGGKACGRSNRYRPGPCVRLIEPSREKIGATRPSFPDELGAPRPAGWAQNGREDGRGAPANPIQRTNLRTNHFHHPAGSHSAQADGAAARPLGSAPGAADGAAAHDVDVNAAFRQLKAWGVSDAKAAGLADTHSTDEIAAAMQIVRERPEVRDHAAMLVRVLEREPENVRRVRLERRACRLKLENASRGRDQLARFGAMPTDEQERWKGLVRDELRAGGCSTDAGAMIGLDPAHWTPHARQTLVDALDRCGDAGTKAPRVCNGDR